MAYGLIEQFTACTFIDCAYIVLYIGRCLFFILPVIYTGLLFFDYIKICK